MKLGSAFMLCREQADEPSFDAIHLTGIDAGDFSRVRNADFRRISVERFMMMINGLGSWVDVKIKVRRAETVAHEATA